MANARYVAVAPHCIVNPIGTVASDHVAAVPNFLALESHGMSVAFWKDLAAALDTPVIQDGYIKVPDGPGPWGGAKWEGGSGARPRARALLRGVTAWSSGAALFRLS